jgi:nitric oxide reductase NorE protein
MTDTLASPLPLERSHAGIVPHQVMGVLTFILADIVVFGMIFVDFLIQRYDQVGVFNESSATLSNLTGIANTLILLTSGLFVALAVQAAKRGQVRQARSWILASFVIGLGFGINKMFEYSDKLSQDITMYTNDFYMYYYTMTGAHFLHFLGGMIALAALWFRLADKKIDNKEMINIESVALYWHMVDLLWIFIFPLLYLMGV